jgi:hypothetical protein
VWCTEELCCKWRNALLRGKGPNFGGLGFELKVCAALGEGGGVDVAAFLL